MGFLYEKQSRRYFLFLTAFCMVLLGCAGFMTALQEKVVRKALLQQERAVISSLLEQGVSVTDLAKACRNDRITEEGIQFLNKVGWSEQIKVSYLPLAAKEIKSYTAIVALTAAALCGVLLAVSLLFLARRERLYQEAADVIVEFADGNFSHHLQRNQEGTLYRLFAGADQLSMALQAKGEAALAAKQGLQDMLSDISHQLKTPLSALTMYADIMHEEPDNPAAVREFSGKSLQALSRMERLIQMLLKVMRLDVGSIVFEKEPCRVEELVRQAAGELMIRAQEEGKRILTEGNPAAEVICDCQWTAEALSNLIKNALDHTDGGGTVRIFWQESPAVLRIFVSDDGSGIAPEDIPHIFKRFYRSKNAKDRQGAGLGLALAKAVVEGQGGFLSVESTMGEGATFSLSFLTEL